MKSDGCCLDELSRERERERHSKQLQHIQSHARHTASCTQTQQKNTARPSPQATAVNNVFFI